MIKNSISTVTICYNNLDELLDTFKSVDRQSRKPDEHLIINGSNTPYITNYMQNNSHPPYRRWIDLPDVHISGSFNYGILNAKSEIINLLNSGDEYFGDEAIETAYEAFSKDKDLMWTHGKYVQFRGGTWVLSGRKLDPSQIYRGMMTIGHPTMFVKKEVYDRNGLFDTGKKIAMDYDLVIRITKEKFRFIDYAFVKFYPGGASSLKQAEGMEEVRDSYRKHKGKSMKQDMWIMRTNILNKFTNTGLGKYLFQLKNKKNKL
ncbi:glycosyltransferase family 2 protein [soil metagenome]